MEDWRKDARHEPITVDLEELVPKAHLLRKIEREKLGKKPIEDDDDNENHPQNGGGSKETVEKTVSTTDPDCGMFVKGEHERQFAYEAHTACDKRGFILGVEVTAGNVHDSVAWDKVYDDVTSKFNVQYVAMDAGYKTPWIAKKFGRRKSSGSPIYEAQRQQRRIPPLGLQI